VDTQGLARDVLARIADHKMTDLAALLAWNWRSAIFIDGTALPMEHLSRGPERD
jgi:hypothetical protein